MQPQPFLGWTAGCRGSVVGELGQWPGEGAVLEQGSGRGAAKDFVKLGLPSASKSGARAGSAWVSFTPRGRETTSWLPAPASSEYTNTPPVRLLEHLSGPSQEKGSLTVPQMSAIWGTLPTRCRLHIAEVGPACRKGRKHQWGTEERPLPPSATCAVQGSLSGLS